jgi:hypothetical protein
MKHLYAMVVWCMVLILMPWYQPVHAQTTAGVDITAQVGFANSYAVMRLTPVVLTVTGDDVDRDVRLEWAITADRGTVVTWYHDITLPARSQKRIEFTTIMPGYARNIVARVRDSNGILRSTIINAEPISDLLSVVIADDTNLLAELNTATLANGAIPAVVRTVTPQAFPSTVAALHGIYTLFIADPLQLTAAQQGAIRAWLHLGGRIVVSGTLADSWRDLGAIEIDTRTDAAATALPDDWPATLRVPVARGIHNALAVRDHEALLWQRSVGRGEVFHTVLPFDATRGWSAQAWYWQPVIEPTYPLSLSTAAFPASGIYNEVLANGVTIPALTQLSPLVIFLIVVTYIVLIAPVTYMLLKRRGTPDLAWITIPATALLVTGVLMISNWAIRGNTTLAYELVVVHQDEQNPDAVSTSSTAIYTPQRQRVTVQNTVATTLIELNEVPTISLAAMDTTVHQADYTSNVGDINYFMGIRLQPRPLDVQHTLLQRNTTLAGTITLTGLALEDVVVVYDTSSQHIGSVASGETVQINIDPQDSAQFPCAETDDPNATFNLQRIYTQIVGPCGAMSALPNNRVTIYGWSNVQGTQTSVVDTPFTQQRQLTIVTLVVATQP